MALINYAAPNVVTLAVRVPPQATAGSDLNSAIAVCPVAGTVTAVNYYPDAAITGANTNTRSVSVVDKGAAGAGNTTIATIQYNSGVNATAFAPNAVTLSGTPANLVVAAGDVLQFASTHVGTGIADPGGLVVVTISRTAGAS